MNYPRWLLNQGFGPVSDGLSILELVNSGTVDCKLAGLLWVLIERRASVLVASGPSYAGKTTLLHALLDFLPPELHRITLQGYYEDFRFTGFCTPAKTYMIAEEISNHGFAEYLWGNKAVKAIRLLGQGYGLGATMHARNSQELLYILNRYLGIPVDMLAHLAIIVNLRAVAGAGEYDEPVRRVVSVDLVISSPEGLMIQALAARQFNENGFAYLDHSNLQQVLTQKGLIGKGDIKTEIDARTRLLKHWLKKGVLARKELRRAVLDFHRSRSK